MSPAGCRAPCGDGQAGRSGEIKRIVQKVYKTGVVDIRDIERATGEKFEEKPGPTSMNPSGRAYERLHHLGSHSFLKCVSGREGRYFRGKVEIDYIFATKVEKRQVSNCREGPRQSPH